MTGTRKGRFVARTITTIALSSMAVAQTQVAIAACGQAHSLSAKDVSEVQSKSIFAIAVSSQGTDINLRDDSQWRFIGNAFLVEQSGILETKGFFATASHNLDAVCRSRSDINGSAPYWLVSQGGLSFKAQAIPANECSRLASIRQSAGNEDVVFVPDVAVVEASLPAGDWKTLMIGSTRQQSGAANGNVQTLNKTLGASSTPTVGLPTRPWQNAQHAAIGDVWTIAGGNLAGTSGSPYVAMVGGKPVVLGIVSHSIPPSGVKIVNGDFVLTASETMQMVAKQYQQLDTGSYSLLFGTESLASTLSEKSLSTESSKLLNEWDGKFGDPGLAERVSQKFLDGNFSSTINLSHFCEVSDKNPAELALRRAACLVVIQQTSSYQCYIDAEQYQKSSLPKISEAIENAGQNSNASLNVMLAIGDLRKLHNAQKNSLLTRKFIAGAMDGLLTAADQSGVSLDKRWHGLALYDLALADKAAGASEATYLDRLVRSLDADESNVNAREALVLATISSKDLRYKAQSVKYVDDVAEKKRWSNSEKAAVAKEIENIE